MGKFWRFDGFVLYKNKIRTYVFLREDDLAAPGRYAPTSIFSGVERMTAAIEYRIEAFNTATASENRIHDDSIARRFGFQGGLVPGVDVYAYMTRAAVIAFGQPFLERGRISCRFGQPVYDGETVGVFGSLDEKGELSIRIEGRGQTLASATAELVTPGAEPALSDYGEAMLPAPDDRPPAGPDSLPEGAALGTLKETTDAASQAEYRASVRENHPFYEESGVVHPGFLLRRANNTLKDTVRLGPWIHVGSTVQHFSPLRAGEPLETRSRVSRLYDHKGHGFVELDVGLFSGSRAIARVDHTAIYEPRQVRTTA